MEPYTYGDDLFECSSGVTDRLTIHSFNTSFLTLAVTEVHNGLHIHSSIFNSLKSLNIALGQYLGVLERNKQTTYFSRANY